MTPQDRPEFIRILTGLSAIKPGVKLTPEGLDVYWLALSDWPLDDFRNAAGHLAKAEEFMPNPYHFAQLRKAKAATAGEAWAKVVAVIRRMNPHEAVSIGAQTDRVIAAMGGYRQLSQTSSDEMHFRAKRFAELWEELGEVDEVRKALPNLQPRVLSGPVPVRVALPLRQGER